MIKFINSWAQGIILAVIIATIIEIILPEGNNKKYVKTVIGIYILFSIVYPLITSISNKSINLNSIISNTSKEMKKYENNNLITIETNSYIENTYKQKLDEDIKQKLKEKDYEVLELNLNIETKDEKKYGQINTVDIKLTKNINEGEKKDNTVNEIQKVDVNISNNSNIQNNEKSNKISQKEIDEIKDYLSDTYSIEKNFIHINE